MIIRNPFASNKIAEISMSKRPTETNRPLLCEQMRHAFIHTLTSHVPLGLEGRQLDDEQLWAILLYASVQGLTIEGACTELAEVPSGTTVRTHLHLIAGRAMDQLTFDLQVEVADRMEYSDHDGRRAVEHFMQDYFRHATQVGELTRIFLTAMEAERLKKNRCWRGFSNVARN